MEVAQSCPTLCNSMDCSPPGCFVHRILQTRILEWVAICPSRGIFLTQGSNPGVQHCRQILYCLSYQGSASKCLKSLSLNPIWDTSYQLKPHFFTHALLCLLQPDLLPAHSTARTFPLSSLRTSKAAKATESFSALSISPLSTPLFFYLSNYPTFFRTPQVVNVPH